MTALRLAQWGLVTKSRQCLAMYQQRGALETITATASSSGALGQITMMTFDTKGSSLDNRMHGKNATRPWLLELRSSKAFATSVVSYAVFAVSYTQAWHNRCSNYAGPIRIRGYHSSNAFHAS